MDGMSPFSGVYKGCFVPAWEFPSEIFHVFEVRLSGVVMMARIWGVGVGEVCVASLREGACYDGTKGILARCGGFRLQLMWPVFYGVRKPVLWSNLVCGVRLLVPKLVRCKGLRCAGTGVGGKTPRPNGYISKEEK